MPLIVLHELAAVRQGWMIRWTPVNPKGTFGNSEVGSSNFLALLANWGPCP